MGEGVLFSLFAGLAVASALVILFLRQALSTVLAAAVHIIAVLALFVLLQAPILALIQFLVMMVLLVGTVQMVRAIGPDSFVTRRRISFGQVLGGLSSVLLGILILLHISAAITDGPKETEVLGWFIPLTPDSLGLLALALLLLLAAIVGVRFLIQRQGENS